jgi:hypothetical protein
VIAIAPLEVRPKIENIGDLIVADKDRFLSIFIAITDRVRSGSIAEKTDDLSAWIVIG